MTPAETREYQDRLDALEARAREATGSDFATVRVMLQSRRILELFPERKPWRCWVAYPATDTPKGRIYPPDVEAYGDCILSAIEAAHREIARRALEENGEAA